MALQKDNDQKESSELQRKPSFTIEEVEKPKEKFFEVVFSAKSNPNDTDDVTLTVNGEKLVIQREKNVILPERFLEAADHARFPHFVQLPNQTRKINAWIKTFPYQRMRESTEQEYLAQKADGTKKSKQIVETFGFDHIPNNPDSYFEKQGA